jgi:hypothetical protein
MKMQVVGGVLISLTMGLTAHAASPGHARAVAKVALAKSVAARLPVNSQPVYADLSIEQLEVSSRVATGSISCELGMHVTVSSNPQAAGRFILELGRERHYMEPVMTSTGAVRLEDVASGAVWLQLANKSMLMNQKLGKRMADACMNAQQSGVAMEMERNPGPGLLDAAVASPVAQPAASVSGVQRVASARK